MFGMLSVSCSGIVVWFIQDSLCSYCCNSVVDGGISSKYQDIIRYQLHVFNWTACFKNISNCLKTNIYSYQETSGGQNSTPNLNVVHFLTPVLIRHLWQLKTVVFQHWWRMHAVLLQALLARLHAALHWWLTRSFQVSQSLLTLPWQVGPVL